MATNLKIPLFEHLGRDVFWAPPLFHILMAIFYKMFSVFGEGAAIFGAQLVTPILASFTLLFNFQIVKHLFNEKIGFYSTLFLTFLPSHLYFSTLAYTDIALMLFVLMSIYFALKRRYVLSGFLSAVSMLTKYTGILTIAIIIPIMIFKERENIRSYVKYLGIAVPIGSIWFIRNWILLGNPIWHFMNTIFNGYSSPIGGASYGLSLLHFFSFRPISKLYAGLIGIPASNWGNLFYYGNIPFLNILLVVWLIGTGIFLFPVFFGLGKLRKQGSVLLFWLIPFIVMGLLYIYNIGTSYLRHLFPILPIMGIVWAFGFIKIKKLQPKFIMTLIILIVIGITSVEFAKAYLASQSIQKYKEDFNWIKKNTEEDSIFLIEGDQAPSFYFDRYTYYCVENTNLSEIDYIWVSPMLPSSYHYHDDFLKELDNSYELVYDNLATQSKIYMVNNTNFSNLDNKICTN